MKKKSFVEYKARVKDFARKEPVKFFAIVLAAILALFWLLSSLEVFPEVPRVRLGQSMVIEQGDSLNWIGMRLVPLSRNIRKEFKIPGRIKGMFILDEGIGVARQYGVKTGDVVLSVSRKPVPNAKAFVNAANDVRYREGILMDIYRDGKSFYLTIPFKYQYGPLMGPNKGAWQLGSPLLGQALPYGPAVTDNTNNMAR
jgi:hypothetical protein